MAQTNADAAIYLIWQMDSLLFLVGDKKDLHKLDWICQNTRESRDAVFNLLKALGDITAYGQTGSN